MKYTSVLAGLMMLCAVSTVQGAETPGAGAVVSGDTTVANVAAEQLHEKEKASGSSSVPVKRDAPEAKKLLDSVDTLARPVLGAQDFAIGGVHRGDSLTAVRKAFGSPARYAKSDHFTRIQYDDMNQALRLVLRNDTADVLKENGEERKAVKIGVDSVFLTKGTKIPIGSASPVYLKYPAEMLVRQFGVPVNVLRDADADVYYFVYKSADDEAMYVFAIANRKVERVALMPARTPYFNAETTTSAAWTERDFSLMGFAVDAPFEANKYNMWSNLIKRSTRDYWLYGSYGLEVSRRKTINKVFLLTNNAYTNRGATLGYHASTILALYGRPDRVEIGPDMPGAVDAYYYDSPFRKGVSLVFVMKHKEHYVDDILLTNEPIPNLQDAMERYGLKE